MKPTVLVSGGNRGLGLAIVSALAAKNYKVLLGCRNVAKGVKAIERVNGDIEPVHLDLSSREGLAKDIENIKVNHPVIDVLINNAAVLTEGTVLDLPSSKIHESMRVNFEAL